MDKLINEISSSESNLVEGVRYPKLLIESLNNLKFMVGLKRIKKEIVVQTYSLIQKRIERGPGAKNENMLSMILHGPPGVGKTEVGIILSRIWYSLGYLEERGIIIGNKSLWIRVTEMFSSGDNGIYFIVLISTMFFQTFCDSYRMMGLKKTLLMFFYFVVFSMVIVVSLRYYFRSETKVETEFISEPTEPKDIQKFPPIRIVSREDLVSQYVGGTALKTREVLESVRCKEVLFIDEAYSLMSGTSNEYGMEALTTINRFMSEHPDEIIVIFAGYKELLDKMFSYQKGLVSRNMYCWNCDPYTSDELCQIFLRKIISKQCSEQNERSKRSAWSDHQERSKYSTRSDQSKQKVRMGGSVVFLGKDLSFEKLLKLFEQYYSIFTSYGRDVDKLIYFCEMTLMERRIISGIAGNEINEEDLIKSLEQLKLNNMKIDDGVKELDLDRLSELLKR